MTSSEWFKNAQFGIMAHFGTDCWGFSVYNNMSYKSAEELMGYKKQLNSKGVNMLLNVGPDHLGRFPGPAVKVLKEMGEMI